ncbi:hypothetical protein M406DRAFT_326425 [Cryphonectria parasitica EP155]|uniref:Uncharacterized protein n=1 Tax=Cryphonectria parasitica (strain ATCC 38755 / EP155) TaxID=660469 RepID=A0A9P5CWA5_CRYP1|nr:uncharacterized protein M406DRAFT_326425 [Cryphonectria parasitica EP155]KAF3771020.1 hypothetical protein M406DRAFT_326425 [Cryphonectria parasitica EP155]
MCINKIYTCPGGCSWRCDTTQEPCLTEYYASLLNVPSNHEVKEVIMPLPREHHRYFHCGTVGCPFSPAFRNDPNKTDPLNLLGPVWQCPGCPYLTPRSDSPGDLEALNIIVIENCQQRGLWPTPARSSWADHTCPGEFCAFNPQYMQQCQDTLTALRQGQDQADLALQQQYQGKVDEAFHKARQYDALSSFLASDLEVAEPPLDDALMVDLDLVGGENDPQPAAAAPADPAPAAEPTLADSAPAEPQILGSDQELNAVLDFLLASEPAQGEKTPEAQGANEPSPAMPEQPIPIIDVEFVDNQQPASTTDTASAASAAPSSPAPAPGAASRATARRAVNHRVKWTPEMDARMRDLLSAGRSFQEVADEMGRSHKSVSRRDIKLRTGK